MCDFDSIRDDLEKPLKLHHNDIIMANAFQSVVFHSTSLSVFAIDSNIRSVIAV